MLELGDEDESWAAMALDFIEDAAVDRTLREALLQEKDDYVHHFVFDILENRHS